MPLALVLAGAYINCNHSRLERYITLYDESFDKAFSKSPMNENDKNRSVRTTWEISFTAAGKQSRDAVELLSLCSFFFHEISLEFLSCRLKLYSGLLSTSFRG
jgi:hypothetical protein